MANTDIPLIYLDRPYYIEPLNKEEKGYALLRDALLQTQRVGLARVVIISGTGMAIRACLSWSPIAA